MKRGCVDRLPSGRWRVRVSDGRGQFTFGTFDTKAQAERELVKAVRISDDKRRDYEGLTVNELGKRVLTRREVKQEVRDPHTDWSRWDHHVKPDEIGRLAVAKLQPKHVHQWLLRLRDKGLSVQTVRNCRNLLSVVLGEATQAGTIRQNPCADVRMRAPRVSAEQGWTYLVPDEQRALLMALPIPERCIVAFAIGTGLRAGELCALHRVDVDAERGRLLVRFGKPPEEPTKTGKVRPVVILGPAVEALRRWLEDVNPMPGGPLFPLGGSRKNRFGVYRDPDHVIDWKIWKAALKEAGLTRRVRWHDLRHTCASSLVSGWWGRRWSLQEVKELLGHTTIDITQRYAHLAPDALEEAARGTLGGQVTLVTPALESGGETVETTSAKLLPESPAPPTGVEPATNGLGIRRSDELVRGICGNDLGVTGEEKDDGHGSQYRLAARRQGQDARGAGSDRERPSLNLPDREGSEDLRACTESGGREARDFRANRQAGCSRKGAHALAPTLPAREGEETSEYVIRVRRGPVEEQVCSRHDQPLPPDAVTNSTAPESPERGHSPHWLGPAGVFVDALLGRTI